MSHHTPDDPAAAIGEDPGTGDEAPHVLVVDDEPDNIALLERQLRRENFQVTHVTSGTEALLVINRQEFDLVLLDLNLPDHKGDELTRMIRAGQEHDGYLPIIILTASRNEDDKLKSLDAGADDYVTKPYNAVELRTRLRNMMRLKQAYDHMRELAVTDSLTGLANRRRLSERLDEEIDRTLRYRHPLSAMMIDIDRFKRINDGFGHQAGDTVLIDLAKLMREHTRVSDVVGRWGGEEFLVLLPETDLDHAQVLAERLRQETETHGFAHEERAIPVTISIGLAGFCADPCESASEFVSRADAALYRAKDRGRNRVVTERRENEAGIPSPRQGGGQGGGVSQTPSPLPG